MPSQLLVTILPTGPPFFVFLISDGTTVISSGLEASLCGRVSSICFALLSPLALNALIILS
ncbi:hypothetical protein BGZ60DRAFT_411686 [Tricladium varicosporioides]|nr:hypothetical protein BGZ60DRAFT_411686 [Hymenoscyphus varicosporioides]